MLSVTACNEKQKTAVALLTAAHPSGTRHCSGWPLIASNCCVFGRLPVQWIVHDTQRRLVCWIVHLLFPLDSRARMLQRAAPPSFSAFDQCAWRRHSDAGPGSHNDPRIGCTLLCLTVPPQRTPHAELFKFLHIQQECFSFVIHQQRPETNWVFVIECVISTMNIRFMS